MEKSDDKQCPICGKHNNCMAHNPSSCWCHNITIPEDIHEFIPEDKRMKACVCKSCIELFIQDEKEFKKRYGN